MIPAAGQTEGGAETAKHEAPILTALSRAFHWQRLLDGGRVASGSERQFMEARASYDGEYLIYSMDRTASAVV